MIEPLEEAPVLDLVRVLAGLYCAMMLALVQMFGQGYNEGT
ncbi:MAG TPA: hypothetical protein VH599_07630 [Ktedonobacterales bacterium]